MIKINISQTTIILHRNTWVGNSHIFGPSIFGVWNTAPHHCFLEPSRMNLAYLAELAADMGKRPQR